jgi:hypothetical protein
VLVVVQPETVVKWHRMGFKLYWRWKSKLGKVGRPCIHHEIRALIRRMSRENRIWGAPRILSELRLLGYDVAESTVAKYMLHDNDSIYGQAFQLREVEPLDLGNVIALPQVGGLHHRYTRAAG